jgi:hypothetical protein
MDQNILSQLNTLLENSSDAVRSVILDGHIDESVLALSTTYHLNVDESVTLKNTVLLTLLGLIPTSEFKQDLAKDIHLDDETLSKLVKDVDTGIFEKARIKLFGEEYEEGHEVKKLTLGNEESKDALREQILANTDRDSAIKTSPIKIDQSVIPKKEEESVPDLVPLDKLVKQGPTPPPPPPEEEKKQTDEDSPVLPASRSELLERLNVLQSIPNSEEVEERVAKIKAQIEHIEEQKQAEEKEADIQYSLTSMKEKANRKLFPKTYSVDPYREIPE